MFDHTVDPDLDQFGEATEDQVVAALVERISRVGDLFWKASDRAFDRGDGIQCGRLARRAEKAYDRAENVTAVWAGGECTAQVIA